MQPGGRRIKQKERDDERGRPLARQLRYDRQYPQKPRHDPYVQSSHREEMKRAGLLERFLDVFRSLMPETEHNSADKILHVRRIIQPTAKRSLHPRA